MENPNPYFNASIELIRVCGFVVGVTSPRIPFLKNDSLVFRTTFKYADGRILETSGFTIKMTIGAEEIDGVAFDYSNGKWDFSVSSEITSLLAAGDQDVTFVLTKTATSEQTFIRIHEAISPRNAVA